MDVRKWVERKAAIAIGESGTSSDVKLIADTYTPIITKLVDCLEEIETKGQCNFLKVHTVLQEFRNE